MVNDDGESWSGFSKIRKRFMNQRKSGNLVVSAALALFAGVLGSVVTLLITNNLTVPVLDTQVPADTSVSAGVSPGLIDEVSELLSEQQAHDFDGAHDELRAALQNATDERAQLAQVLAQLTRQIESLESDAINLSSLAELEEATNAASEQSAEDLSALGNFGAQVPVNKRVADLVAAGVDVDSAQALQDRQDRFQLERLEVFDLAQREGWIDTERFSTQLEELEEQRPDLREELGDEQYDRYLFEAGRNNRVVIDSIIPGSAAELAGLQPQDMVMSYAQGRVFSTGDLQQATRAGVRGEFVPMQVERQGQSLFFDVARGPLGITLRASKQSPS